LIESSESSPSQDSLADIESFISSAIDPRAVAKERALLKQDEEEKCHDSFAYTEAFASGISDPETIAKQRALFNQDDDEENSQREEQPQITSENSSSETPRPKKAPPLPGAYRADSDGIVPTESNRNAKDFSYSQTTMRRVESYETERRRQEDLRSLKDQTLAVCETEVSLREGMPDISENPIIPETKLKRSSNEIANNISSDRNNDAKTARRRRKYVVLGSVVIIILIIVGVLAGTENADLKQSSDNKQKATTDNIDIDQCYNSTTDISERYQSLRTEIISRVPNIASAVDNRYSSARRSLCWIALADLSISNYELIQRFVMGMVYYRFVEEDGDVPPFFRNSKWLNDESICNWDFIECENDQIQALKMQTRRDAYRLEGRIPTELALLSSLTYLDLDGHGLSGEIPPELWSMNQLKVLKLGLNDLTGELSNELSNLVQLEELFIGSNYFSGTIPELNNLFNLKELDIRYNNFIGSLPSILECKNLVHLDIRGNYAGNNLDGTIPSYIWGLTNLTSLSFGLLDLSGTISTEIGHLTNIESLHFFEMDELGGALPTEIGKLTKSTILALPDLDLNGEIPSELGMLSNLEKLHLQGVAWDGTMPQEICSLSLGSELWTDMEISRCRCCIL